MKQPSRLLLAGCGKMGSALLTGWLQQGTRAQDLYIVEPNPETAAHLTDTFAVSVFHSPDALPPDLAPAVVMLAVKPQMMDGIIPAYSRFCSPDTVYLSIAAGKTVSGFEKLLGSGAAIVRAMPNTPAAVGRGVTVCCRNANVSDGQQALCSQLLRAVGSVEWVEDEAMIDVVTALSGGGPAYVFLLSESLALAGIRAGLPADLAWRLARETVAGSGELLFQSSEHASTLRKNVTSPGGTTAEALRVLMGDGDSQGGEQGDGQDGWQPLIDAAIQAATDRSRELSH